MKELGYNTISRVMETWETARRVTKNFEDELGTHMLTKYDNDPKRARVPSY